MSKIFNFSDIASLYQMTEFWEPILTKEVQDYAFKYIFGLIERERKELRKLKQDYNLGGHEIQRRLCMLKQLASTIARLKIENTGFEKRQHLVIKMKAEELIRNRKAFLPVCNICEKPVLGMKNPASLCRCNTMGDWTHKEIDLEEEEACTDKADSKTEHT